MDAQPKTARPSSDTARRERNAALLGEVLATGEHLLRRQARKHAQLPEDADDALQTAYERFIERFEPERFEPLAWLYTIVKREAWGLRRRHSRRRELSLDFPLGESDDPSSLATLGELAASDQPGPAERTLAIAEQRHREALFATLKPDERRALMLFALGCSYREICELTGWTYTKVNRCIAEGREALRRHDAEREGESS